jgi:ssDNA-binding replication factor A large subunit
MEPGDLVAIENGYTRLSLGAVGLNVGQSGRIDLNPKDVEVEKPSIEEKIVNLSDIREGMTNIYVRGTVLEAPEVREVETARGPATVASFRIDDKTGEARVSVWRDLVDEVEGLEQGNQIRIENCNIREPFDGLLQVSSGMFTRIVLEQK